MIKVTCAIIIQDNKLLITQRGPGSDHPWKWEFPGGKVNKDESAEDCILREIYEELNVTIRILKKMNPVEYDYGFKNIRLIPFLCIIESGAISLNEHHDFKWIIQTELVETAFSAADRKLVENGKNREILKEYFGENMYDTR